MKLSYVETDLFEAIKQETSPYIIAHVCNDVSAFGAGFVVPLGKNFPEVKRQFLKDSNTYKLGETQFVRIPELTVVANMIAQRGLISHKNRHPLKYCALATALAQVEDFAIQNNINKIHAPFFGAGLAGGYWPLIRIMIEETWVENGIEVQISYLSGQTPKDWDSNF